MSHRNSRSFYVVMIACLAFLSMVTLLCTTGCTAQSGAVRPSSPPTAHVNPDTQFDAFIDAQDSSLVGVEPEAEHVARNFCTNVSTTSFDGAVQALATQAFDAGVTDHATAIIIVGAVTYYCPEYTKQMNEYGDSHS